jgi:hypothetical protein
MSNHPASQADAFHLLKALFFAFPVERFDGTSAAATYLIAVEGYSLRAIEQAVRRLIRGEFEWFSGRFLPTTAEVSRACRYCEDLIAPPRRYALPAPGDIRDDSPAAVAQRQAFVERVRLTRFDWKQVPDGNAPHPNPIHSAVDFNAQETREKIRLGPSAKQ